MPELTQAYLTWKYELSDWSMSLSSFQLLLSNLLSIKHVMTTREGPTASAQTLLA